MLTRFDVMSLPMAIIFRHQMKFLRSRSAYRIGHELVVDLLGWQLTISRSCWDLCSLELTITFIRNTLLKFLSYCKHSGDTKFQLANFKEFSKIEVKYLGPPVQVVISISFKNNIYSYNSNTIDTHQVPLDAFFSRAHCSSL